MPLKTLSQKKIVLSTINQKNIEKQFDHISFEAQRHLYFSDKQEYISVSAFLEQFTKVFDRNNIAKKVSKKKGISAEEIKTHWEIRRDYSIVRGTEFHLYVEKYLKENRKNMPCTPIDHEIKEFHRFWDQKNKNRYEVVATELVVADDELLIAGTLDCLVKNNHNNHFYLFDWKTNQEIKNSNTYENFKKPLSHLENCHLNKYSLQSSIYKKLLEKKIDITIKKKFLIHFPRNKTYQVIPIKNLDQEVEALFEERQKKLKTSIYA